MNIFVGQGLLTLKLNMGSDISTASTKRILYKKPSGTTGYWAATLDGITTLSYDLSNSDLNEAGIWTFQGYIVIGGRAGYGNPVQKDVKPNLT